MRDVGILFKPELYGAIIDGLKTETRRLVEHRHKFFSHDTAGIPTKTHVRSDRGWARLRAGDTLWVREKLMRQDADGHPSWAEYHRDGRAVGLRWRWGRDWLSPLHMPRCAARLILRLVEDARVERVADITDEGAIREGVYECVSPADEDGPGRGRGYRLAGVGPMHATPRAAFLAAWDEVHGQLALGHRELIVVLRFEVIATGTAR